MFYLELRYHIWPAFNEPLRDQLRHVLEDGSTKIATLFYQLVEDELRILNHALPVLCRSIGQLLECALAHGCNAKAVGLSLTASHTELQSTHARRANNLDVCLRWVTEMQGQGSSPT